MSDQTWQDFSKRVKTAQVQQTCMRAYLALSYKCKSIALAHLIVGKCYQKPNLGYVCNVIEIPCNCRLKHQKPTGVDYVSVHLIYTVKNKPTWGRPPTVSSFEKSNGGKVLNNNNFRAPYSRKRESCLCLSR